MALATSLLAGCATYATRGPAGSATGPRQAPDVALALDGVPYEAVRTMWEAGEFPGFAPPARMVAPFPSLTLPAHSDIWRAGAVAGYEDRYYDRAARRVRGGIVERLTNRRPQAFHARYGFEETKLAGALVYLWPRSTSERALAGLAAYLRAGGGKRSALLMSSDALGHVAGERELAGYLGRVAALVRERAARGERITLFSDHGNDRAPSRRVDLGRALAGAGIASGAGGEVRRGRAVVPAYGLVGFAAVHVDPADEERAARALAWSPGVDLVALRAGAGRARLLSRRGEAEVERVRLADGSQGYAYRPTAGDPLRLGGGLELAETAWLEATAACDYPDAPRRLVRAVEEALVANRAAILVSLEDGFHAGPALFSRLVELRGTHGSLGRAQSLGFVLANWTAVAPALRSDDVHAYLLEQEAPHAGTLAAR